MPSLSTTTLTLLIKSKPFRSNREGKHIPTSWQALSAILKSDCFERYDQNELDFFADFETYIHKPAFISNTASSKFFATVDYCKCFRHALANKNQEVACFLLVMLRYLYLKHPDDYEKKTALSQFNRAFLSEFLPQILEYGLFDIVNLLLDIKKIDVLIRNRSLSDKKYAKKKGNLNKKEFIRYEHWRWNHLFIVELPWLKHDCTKFCILVFWLFSFSNPFLVGRLNAI